MERISQEKAELIEAYRYGRLDPGEKTAAEKLLMDSPDCRMYLRFLESLAGAAHEASGEAPADFADRVMEEVGRRSRPRFALNAWAPALATGIACLAVGWFAGTSWENRRGLNRVAVRFALNAPGASRVALAGDFTGWNPVPLHQRAGAWESVIDVPRGGRYQYVFIINGRTFIVDPRRDEVETDSSGSYSVLDTSTI